MSGPRSATPKHAGGSATAGTHRLSTTLPRWQSLSSRRRGFSRTSIPEISQPRSSTRCDPSPPRWGRCWKSRANACRETEVLTRAHRVRLRSFASAVSSLRGKRKWAFTSGLLVGIGETRDERLRSLLAIRSVHERYGHVQEVIIQNFRAKERTRMEKAPNASREEMLWTVAVSRILLGPTANIQVPPNLSLDDFEIYLHAGINDWGGVSPVTKDFVNPEAPWPELESLSSRTEAIGHRLEARLPIYPAYFHLLPARLAERARTVTARNPLHHAERAS